MGYYKIYTGLGGSFGGAEYLWTDQYTSEDEAVDGHWLIKKEYNCLKLKSN